MCGLLSQLVTITTPTSEARTFTVNGNNFTFTNLISNTSYDVTIVLKYKRDQLITKQTTIKTSPTYRMSGTIIVAYITTTIQNALVLHYNVATVDYYIVQCSYTYKCGCM